MAVLARGPAGPSRSSKIGGALGSAFSGSFAPAFQETREELQLQDQFNPILESLRATLTGGVSSPGQQLIQQITSDPSTFSQVMQQPELAQTILSLNQASRPTSGFATIDEINATLDAAVAATDRGELVRARELFARARSQSGRETVGGVEFDNPSDQAALRVRATGGNVESGRFEISTNRLTDINALTPEQAEEQLTVGRFGRTAQDEESKITASQRLAAGFGQRLEDSNQTITELGGEFTGVFSRLSGVVPQGLRPEERQLFNQATENFINATLRRESGAAIQPSEFENANIQYIPQPGDSSAVLEQKTRNRLVIEEQLKLEAGEAFTQLEEVLKPQTVTIQGVEYEIGAIVENDNGDQGRVEADGSITVL